MEKIITANTLEELDEKVKQDIVEQGWNADGQPVQEPDGTYSQKLVKEDSKN